MSVITVLFVTNFSATRIGAGRSDKTKKVWGQIQNLLESYVWVISRAIYILNHNIKDLCVNY